MIASLFAIGTFIVIATILSFLSLKKRKAKLLSQIRKQWTNPKNEYFDFENISKFSNSSAKKRFHRLSQQMLNDIDFYSLFSFLDRTTSRVGQQALFNRLIHPTNSLDELTKLDACVSLFSTDVALRESTQVLLRELKNHDAYYLVSLTDEITFVENVWNKLSRISTAVVIVLLLLLPLFPFLVIALLVAVTLNIPMHYWNKARAHDFIRSFPQLNILIDVSKKLNRTLAINEKSIAQSIAQLKPFQRKLKLINFGQDGTLKTEVNQIGHYFFELLKAVFLLENHALASILKELENKKDAITALFNFVGDIDTAISIASLRSGTLQTCKPNLLLSSKSLRLSKAYHPLVENCVTNELDINEKSILITGSNMSGKTTFLRMIAINSILAQTIFTCFAESYSSPMLRQFSSIRIDDNLLEGKSYFLAEVSLINDMIQEVNSGYQNLFLLDEVLRGTNTLERIAASKAILSYLSKVDNLVIVSTHDMELATLLKDQFNLYHFSETVKDNQLSFDHTIKEGPLTTRNAIMLLELTGFPIEITEEARLLTKNQ